MHSFVSLSLLSILSFSFQLLHSSALSGFLISSGSLLEILCLFILFTSSVSILIINAWNSLSGKLFIFVSLSCFFRKFSCSFVWNNCLWASLAAQTVKRLPTMWETCVQSLGQEDLLEKAMATNSSTLAWKIPRTRKPGRLRSMGSQRVGHDWATSLSLSMKLGLNGYLSRSWRATLV